MLLNRRELDILSILCASENSLTVMQIVEKKRGLTQSTVTAVLRKLLRAGLVEVDGVTHSGKVLSRLFKPTEACKQAITEYFQAVYKRVVNVVSPREICGFIINQEVVAGTALEDEITQLKEVVREYEKML